MALYKLIALSVNSQISADWLSLPVTENLPCKFCCFLGDIFRTVLSSCQTFLEEISLYYVFRRAFITRERMTGDVRLAFLFPPYLLIVYSFESKLYEQSPATRDWMQRDGWMQAHVRTYVHHSARSFSSRVVIFFVLCSARSFSFFPVAAAAAAAALLKEK